MNSHFEYNAPWGRSLKIMTGLSAVILVGIPVIGIFTGPHGSLLDRNAIIHAIHRIPFLRSGIHADH